MPHTSTMCRVFRHVVLFHVMTDVLQPYFLGLLFFSFPALAVATPHKGSSAGLGFRPRFV